MKPLIDNGIVEVSKSRQAHSQFDSNTYQLTDKIHLRNH